MAIFDSKHWNDAVFQKYLKKIPNLKENSLVKNGVFEVNKSLKTRLKDGVGGNLLIEPIKGLIDGEVVNYDGSTNITTSSRDTFQQKKIVVGRAKGWEEKDFSTELTGEDFMPVAQEVAEYFQGVDMQDVLSILSGIFSMTSTNGQAFANAHTLDITDETNPNMGATTINTAVQKAFGDKKRFINMAFMHSYVATGLENLQLLDYLKYTDANGIQSNIEIAQIGNKMVIIDDDMPVNEVTEGTGDDAVTYNEYTTYLLGKGAFEYCNIGAKVPSEVSRDPSTNGGVDKLYTRQRKLYAPKYVSWEGASNIISPTATQLATGSNWDIVNNGKTGNAKVYVNHKLIPFARIITKG